MTIETWAIVTAAATTGIIATLATFWHRARRTETVRLGTLLATPDGMAEVVSVRALTVTARTLTGNTWRTYCLSECDRDRRGRWRVVRWWEADAHDDGSAVADTVRRDVGNSGGDA
jgi:hypothetical protein